MLVLLQRGGGGVVLGIAEADKAALGWPTDGHWPGHSWQWVAVQWWWWCEERG